MRAVEAAKSRACDGRGRKMRRRFSTCSSAHWIRRSSACRYARRPADVSPALRLRSDAERTLSLIADVHILTKLAPLGLRLRFRLGFDSTTQTHSHRTPRQCTARNLSLSSLSFSPSHHLFLHDFPPVALLSLCLSPSNVLDTMATAPGV